MGEYGQESKKDSNRKQYWESHVNLESVWWGPPRARSDRELALSIREAVVVVAHRKVLQECTEGQKAHKRFHRAPWPDLSPSHSLPCASLSVSWGRGLGKHRVSYWDQSSPQKDSISTFWEELDGMLTSNHDRSRQEKLSLAGHCELGSPWLWLNTQACPGQVLFHIDWGQEAIRTSYQRLPSLPLTCLIFFFFFFFSPWMIDSTQGYWHQDTSPLGREDHPTRDMGHRKGLSTLGPNGRASAMWGWLERQSAYPGPVTPLPMPLMDTCHGSGCPLSGPLRP